MSDLDLDNLEPAEEPKKASSGGGGMDYGIIGGLVIGFVSLSIGMVLEGTSPKAYVEPSAAIIVFGGTIGAVMTAVGLSVFLTMGRSFMRAIKYASINRVESINILTRFAERARREGLLVLEDDLQQVEDEFLKKGVQLVVDGTDPELVKEILQTEVDAVAEVNEREAGAWDKAGGFSPTLGIIGTVMGLVNVLANMGDAASLGPAIAVAFIATFYGVCFANLVYLPIAMKLKDCSEDEIAGRELMLEGILAIQSGDNPRIVEEKLVAFLDAADKKRFHAANAKDDEFDLAA